MKAHLIASQRGVTLLEVILVVALVAILSVMTVPIFQGWRTSASTRACIYNVSRVQQAMRAHTGLNNLVAGSALNSTAFLGGAAGLLSPPRCPTGAAYIYASIVPITGQPFASCPVGPAHSPTTTAGW